MPLETRIQHHSTSFNLSSLALIVWLCLFLRIHVFLLNGLCFGCWTVPLNISRGVKRSQVAVSSRCFQALVDLWTPRRGHMVPFGTWSHGIHGKPWEKPTRILWISDRILLSAIRSLIRRGNLGSPFFGRFGHSKKQPADFWSEAMRKLGLLRHWWKFPEDGRNLSDACYSLCLKAIPFHSQLTNSLHHFSEG